MLGQQGGLNIGHALFYSSVKMTFGGTDFVPTLINYSSP